MLLLGAARPRRDESLKEKTKKGEARSEEVRASPSATAITQMSQLFIHNEPRVVAARANSTDHVQFVISRATSPQMLSGRRTHRLTASKICSTLLRLQPHDSYAMDQYQMVCQQATMCPVLHVCRLVPIYPCYDIHSAPTGARVRTMHTLPMRVRACRRPRTSWHGTRYLSVWPMASHACGIKCPPRSMVLGCCLSGVALPFVGPRSLVMHTPPRCRTRPAPRVALHLKPPRA